MQFKPKKLIGLHAKQSGAALILIAFMLVLLAGAYMVKSLQGMSIQSRQDEKTMQALNEAKAALIAWSVSHEHTPGQMPWPDRNGDGNYDGSSDCVTTSFQNSYLLGQLPSQPTTSPCLDPNTGLNIYTGLSTYSGLGKDFRDAQGNRLWYAVSKNLVHDYETNTVPVINSGISNTSTWLKVLDRNGNLISNRVAAVIIAPGATLPNQSRTGVADASTYLDTFDIGMATYNNHTYAITAEDFIMGEDSSHVSDSDMTFTKPYYFNDKLVYITIDELMAALEKRVGETARVALKNYQDTNGYYPYATQLGTTINPSCWQDSTGITGLSSGHLPTNHQACTYTRNSSGPSTSISCTNPVLQPAATSLGITQIRFTRSGGSNFTESSQTVVGGISCSFTTSVCTCISGSGLGSASCGNATNNPRVTCSSTGCTATGTGALGTFRTTGDKFTYRTGGCAQLTFPNPSATTACATNNAAISCATNDGTFASCSNQRFDTYLPAWFNKNNWGPYIYYQMTRPAASSISVGNQTTEAAVMTIGNPIVNIPYTVKGSAQNRAVNSTRCKNLNEYLDSAENVSINDVYDAKFKARAKNYNDQTFAVDP